ncbi:MAG: N-acetylmuramoyl-L-alanine amidase [Campylobacteraceae bacterium]|jgi:N-acetylmuramoyl-L-alanine amidase|nr:N-acetylmuramoyl-L-alanine amidase [Campylobacteraceae bacterium]
MIKKVFAYLLLLICFVHAENVLLDEFDSKFSILTWNEKEHIYDDLKHLYIKSIMDANDTLKYEVLKRLVEISEELSYDTSTYKKELDKLPKYQSIAAIAAQREKKDTIVSPDVLVKLLQIKVNNGSAVLVFDKKTEKQKIKFLKLKDKSLRYVYDIKGIKTSSAVVPKIEGIKDFRISQFDKETIRVVFEHEKDISIILNLKDKELKFSAKEFAASQANSAKKDDKTISATTTPKVKIPKKIIVVDAGHGGKDGGAVSDKKLEKDVVLQIALLLGAELETRGHKVFYTRSKDVYLKLQDRTKTANDKNADIFISIHANAAPKTSKNGIWQGIETFFLSPSDSVRSKNAAELENKSDIEEMNLYSKQTFLNFLNREKIIASHKLAIDIQQYILTEVRRSYKNVVDGGVREAPFWVLTGAQMPAVLLEIGYITDKIDRERMFNKKFQQILTTGIANGIESYFAKNK